jgi:hypothetical protein
MTTATFRYRGITLLILFATAFAPAYAQRHGIEAQPRFVRLEIVAQNRVLNGPQARQQLLVNGYRRDGSVLDLTDSARFESSNPKSVVVDRAGVVHPVQDGQAAITAHYGALTGSTVLSARNTHKPYSWSFDNHVESVLSKQGCNMGICHGAASGKGGFRLSLRAYDPEADYQRLRHEARGRRLSLASPAQSLLLLKPSLSLGHFGGLRLKPGSLEYRVVADWITAGAPAPRPDGPKIVSLDVYPKERVLLLDSPLDAPGSEPRGVSAVFNSTRRNRRLQQRLLVTAHFSDGHTEDVTHWARYSSNEESLATVDDSGRITMRGVGETAISVWYLGKVAFARMTVPYPNTVDSARYRGLPRNNFIDDRVSAKLATLRLWPSDICTDAEYARRAFLDAIGILPTPEELRTFLNDTHPERRANLIDRLLSRSEFVDRWTYNWCDLLRVNRDMLGDKGMWSLYHWIHTSVAENKPWDRFVREILTAQGSGAEYGPVNFYRMGAKPEEFSETVSQAFLGIRVQCAHCHNHPFEKWTQTDYYRMANFFSRLGRKGKHAEEIVYAAESGNISHPKLGRPLPPAAFDGPSLALEAPGDRRAFLADWLTSPDNPYFARAVVNRIWKRYMGRGLVEPVDDMRLTNPASNEPLLQALTQDFVAHHFDIKHLMRTILLSRTYQLSSRPNATNRLDDRFYSRCLPRRLPAEILLDAICQVTGQPEPFPDAPPGTRAMALPDTHIASPFLDAFGRPPRQVTCECERNGEPNVAQALHLINANTLNAKITVKGGLIDRLLASGKSDREIVEDLYLRCLSRSPSQQEMSSVLHVLSESLPPGPSASPSPANTIAGSPPDLPRARAQIFDDLLWALLSGSEFQFNH